LEVSVFSKKDKIMKKWRRQGRPTFINANTDAQLKVAFDFYELVKKQILLDIQEAGIDRNSSEFAELNSLITTLNSEYAEVEANYRRDYAK